ncbi:hypothetical protein KCU78_g10940, partial [Aureobasidium melanogenum]
MVDKNKNSKAAEYDLPTTNNAHWNQVIRTVEKVEQNIEASETAEPHEETAAEAKLSKATRGLVFAISDSYTRHGSFPLNRNPNNFTDEQLRQCRRLYDEAEAKLQRIDAGATDEPRHFESLEDFAKAFDLKLPEELKDNEHQRWMPKNCTPIDLKGNVLKSEELLSKKGSSVDEARDGENGDDEA